MVKASDNGGKGVFQLAAFVYAILLDLNSAGFLWQPEVEGRNTGGS